MYLHCLGVNHNTANVALRECLSFTPNQLNSALARLGCGMEVRWNNIHECIILSTCSRVEIYAVSDQPVKQTLETFLAEIQGVMVEKISSVAYYLADTDAVTHLLRVAAGLDSIVLGESQILGQVTDAYAAARRHGTPGKILSRLFQTAIRAGKRTRTETAISHNPGSISSVAVNLIARTVSNLETSHILVVGAGEMADLAVGALRKRGVTRFTVANRTLERAKLLADRWNGKAATLEFLPSLLQEADAVISSTGAPHLIISKSLVEEALRFRPDRPLVLMDIAVPRDVDPDVAQLPQAMRFDMDDLAARLEDSLSKRRAEVPAVEEILIEEQAAFLNYMATLDVLPVIIGIREQANAIREAELEKAIRHLPDLSGEAQQQLDFLTKSIVQKILHHPTLRLREAAGTSSQVEYTGIARSLFGLDGETNTS